MVAVALVAALGTALVPSHAAACSAPPASAVASPIHVPIVLSGNHVYVKVCSGDRALEFILDTGAGQSFFDLGVARAAGVRLGSHFTGRGAGAGTIDGAATDGGSVTLADTPVTVPIRAALDLSGLGPREGRSIDGILGHDFIERYVVTIDYVRRELRLLDADHFEYAGPGTSLPITFSQNHPVVTTSLRLANGDSLGGRFVVDVGASSALSLTGTFVQAHALRSRIQPLVQRIGGGGVGGMTRTDVGRVATLRLGGAEVHNVVTSLYGDSAGVMSGNEGWIGNIGGDVLRRFTVFLDYRHRRIILEPHAGTDQPFEGDMSGAGFVIADTTGRLVVTDIVRDSPAAQAGLAIGDTVVAVDGVPPGDRALPALRDRLHREGETVALSVLRGGATTTIRFRTKRLI
jgi:PDZ domain-containing protein/aspartyl protease